MTSKINFLAIGTTSGHGALVQNENVDTIDLGKGEITGLGAVPQVGYFAFIAAHNGRAVGVNPNTSGIVFDLADPRPDPLLDLSTGAVFEPNSEPLTEPAPVSFVAANGTPDVAVLEIPANPAIGGTMKVGIVVIDGCPIAEVDRGSLFMLEAGGEALLYDPGFTLESGGSGVVFTIAGASLDFDPDVLNFGSRGNYVTATIEVENDHATAIDTMTIALEYGGTSVLSAPGFPPQIGDSDEDGQAVLAKFDRAAVQAMLNAAPEGPVTLQATWTFIDGSPGSAAGTIRMIK